MFIKNASLLHKFGNQIPSHTFPTKVIPSVFDEVNLAVYEFENA